MTTQLETEDRVVPPDDRSKGSGRWAVGAYRILITLAALVLFNQAVLAGQFMSGTFESLEFHSIGASVADGIVLFALVAAGLARYRRLYSWWPVSSTGLLLVAMQGQEFAGEQRILTLHIPLGVLLIMSVSWLAVWAWRES